MLGVTTLKHRGAAGRGGASHVVDYLMAGEYYAGEKELAGVWQGEGAKALGLSGEVDREALALALEGFGQDGKPMVRNAGEAGRRMGYDFTFNAPKTVSLAYAVASPEQREQIMAAHHAAVEAAQGFMFEQIQAEQREGRNHGALRFAVARFDHFSARPTDPKTGQEMDGAPGDVHVHSHCVALAMAQDASGKWVNFDARATRDYKHAAGALYRADLAHRMRGLGFNIDSQRELDERGQETGQVWHEVAGVGREAVEHFSKRRAEVERYAKEHGVGTDLATVQSRQRKAHGEPSVAETLHHTQAQLDDLRERGVIQWRSADDLKRAQGHDLGTTSDAEIMRRLHAHEATWNRAELIDRIAKEHGGRLGAAEVLREAQAFVSRNVERGELLRIPGEQRERYVSREHLQTERDVLRMAEAGRDDPRARLAPDVVAQAIADHEQAQGFTLTQEQRQAVEWITQGTGRVACLSGYAGSGKTATAGAYIRAFQVDGRDVVGTAQAWKAANKLKEETGLETFSTASLLQQLQQGTRTLSERSVVVLDEAGMADAKTVRDLMQHTEEAGAKLVMLGDAKQLQPIGAGSGFTLAISRTGEARTTEIRRQQHEQDRAQALAFYDQARNGQGLVQGMEQRGQLTEHDTQRAARAALVRDWMADTRPEAEKLVIAPTNAAADGLNDAIRAAKKERGELRNAATLELPAKIRGHAAREFEVAEGDRLRFGAKDNGLGIVNNDEGTVQKIHHDQDGHVRLHVRLADAREVEVDTHAYKALSHAYAGTVHKAQGQGTASVYWLADGGNIDRNMGLVAYTRGKQDIHAYTADKQGLAERLDEWQEKENAAVLVQHETAPRKFGDALQQVIGQEHGRRVLAFRQRTPEQEQKPAPEKKPERKVEPVSSENMAMAEAMTSRYLIAMQTMGCNDMQEIQRQARERSADYAARGMAAWAEHKPWRDYARKVIGADKKRLEAEGVAAGWTEQEQQAQHKRNDIWHVENRAVTWRQEHPRPGAFHPGKRKAWDADKAKHEAAVAEAKRKAEEAAKALPDWQAKQDNDGRREAAARELHALEQWRKTYQPTHEREHAQRREMEQQARQQQELRESPGFKRVMEALRARAAEQHQERHRRGPSLGL